MCQLQPICVCVNLYELKQSVKGFDEKKGKGSIQSCVG